MKKNSTKKNYLYNLSYKLLNIGMPLITAPYLSRVVGAEGLGIYAYYFAIAHYFYLFGKMGLNNYGTRKISINYKDKLTETFSTIYSQQIYISLIMQSIYITFCLTQIESENGIVPIILGVYTIGCMFDIDWLYCGLQQFDRIALKNIFVKILTLIGVFVFVRSEDDLWKYTVIMSFGMLIGFGSLWINVKKYTGFYLVSPRKAFLHFKPNFVLMIPILAINIYRSMDKLMVGNMSGMEELGYYDNAEKIIYATLGLITSLNNVLMPKCCQLIASKSIENCKKIIKNAFIFLAFLITGISFAYFALSEKIVLFIFGNSFSRSIVLLQILSVTLIVMMLSDVVRALWIIPNKKDYIFLWSIGVGAVINIFLNICLIPQYGAVGASLATVFVEFIVCCIQYLFLRKELNYCELFSHGSIFIISGGLMAIVLRNLQQLIENFLMICIGGSVVYIVTLTILYWLFRRKELYMFINYVRSMLISRKI